MLLQRRYTSLRENRVELISCISPETGSIFSRTDVNEISTRVSFLPIYFHLTHIQCLKYKTITFVGHCQINTKQHLSKRAAKKNDITSEKIIVCRWRSLFLSNYLTSACLQTLELSLM